MLAPASHSRPAGPHLAGHTLGLAKEAYTTEEAAERLGRSDWTVRQWCNKGQVPGAYKVRVKGRTGATLARLQAEGPRAVAAAPALAV